jgi:DnaJ-like protein
MAAAEKRIREAIAQGRFDNLSGVGQPLSLEEYFSTPEKARMAYSILKNANCAPAEVELLNEVSRLERAVAQTTDVAAVAAGRGTLSETMHVVLATVTASLMLLAVSPSAPSTMTRPPMMCSGGRCVASQRREPRTRRRDCGTRRTRQAVTIRLLPTVFGT